MGHAHTTPGRKSTNLEVIRPSTTDLKLADSYCPRSCRAVALPRRDADDMNFLQVRRPSTRNTRMNPLLLPSIIQRSFGYLGCQDLLKCRKVNKLWNEEATKLLQDSVIVTLSDGYSADVFHRVFSSHVKHSPYNIFSAATLAPSIIMTDRNLQATLGKISHFVKHLRVHTKVGSAEWRLILFDQFTNLKELYIHGPVPFQPVIAVPEVMDGKHGPSVCPSSPPHYSKSNPSIKHKDLVNLTKVCFNLTNRKSEDIFVRRFLRDLFSVSPNLQSLEWIKEDPFGNEFQRTMFDCLMNKVKVGNMGHLKIFKCPSLVCGTKELKDISIRAFPLEEVHIQISTEISAHFLEEFLEGLGNTLKVLKLGFCPGTPLNVIVGTPLSRLVNLREISLIEYRRSIGFIGHLPNLKKLVLTRTNIKRALLSVGWSFESKERTELSKSLTDLLVFNDYLSREQGNCTREIVLKLAHCFPNLKVLRLEGLDDSSIRHLFKSFHNLEQLFAPMGTYSDEAFRSYTDKDQLMGNGGKSPSRLTSAFDASHLTRLRTLELESIGLSDRFVTQGIINWRSLRNLTVKYCRIGFPTLSRIIMEMDLHLLRLEFCTVLTDRVLEVVDDPVEMMHEDDTLELTSHMIQKLRFGAFRMLFVQSL